MAAPTKPPSGVSRPNKSNESLKHNRIKKNSGPAKPRAEGNGPNKHAKRARVESPSPSPSDSDSEPEEQRPRPMKRTVKAPGPGKQPKNFVTSTSTLLALAGLVASHSTSLESSKLEKLEKKKTFLAKRDEKERRRKAGKEKKVKGMVDKIRDKERDRKKERRQKLKADARRDSMDTGGPGETAGDFGKKDSKRQSLASEAGFHTAPTSPGPASNPPSTRKEGGKVEKKRKSVSFSKARIMT